MRAAAPHRRNNHGSPVSFRCGTGTRINGQRWNASSKDVTVPRQSVHSAKRSERHAKAAKPPARAGTKLDTGAFENAPAKPNGDWFHSFAAETARLSGRPVAFVLAVSVIVIWGVTGPLFGFSDTWQLVINTGTTIVTFLMVFLIQHTQNRDALAFQVKLDELIRVTEGAHNALLDLEELDEDEQERIRGAYEKLAAE